MMSEELFRSYARVVHDYAMVGSKGGSKYNMKFRDVNVEVYPGIFTHDPIYARFLKTLHKELADTFKPSVIKDGLFVGPPVTGDFSKLLTLGGSVRPLTYSPARVYSEDKSHPDVLKMVDRLVKIVYNNDRHINNPVVSNMSSSGAPLFVSDSRSKIEHLGVIAKNLDVFDRLWASRDLRKLADKLGIIFLSTAQIRRQADKWIDGAPKRRTYVSYLGAYDLEDRRLFNDDELLVNIGGVDLGTCRTRVVNAYSGVINNFLTVLIAPIRDTAEHEYEFTFKHRTQEEKLAKIKKFKYSLGLDATQYDASVKYDVMSHWIDGLPIKDEIKELAKVFARSPFFSSEVQMCDGDIFNIDTFNYWRGLPSGIAFTSVLGKVNMVSHVLTALEQYVGRELLDDEISSILKGKSAFGILNMSDDTILLGSEKTVNGVFANLKKLMDVEQEEGTAFLGDLFYLNKYDDLKAAHNLESYVVNWYVPERSIGSRFRPYPMFGAVDRRKIFSDHPFFKDCDLIVKDVFKRFFADDRDLLELRHMVMPSQSGPAQSYADIEVLTNYEKLYYKYVYSDISKDVAELFESCIPDEIKNPIQDAYFI